MNLLVLADSDQMKRSPYFAAEIQSSRLPLAWVIFITASGKQQQQQKHDSPSQTALVSRAGRTSKWVTLANEPQNSDGCTTSASRAGLRFLRVLIRLKAKGQWSCH